MTPSVSMVPLSAIEQAMPTILVIAEDVAYLVNTKKAAVKKVGSHFVVTTACHLYLSGHSVIQILDAQLHFNRIEVV